MNVAQAINANDQRRRLKELRRMAGEIRHLSASLPYCDKCGQRVLRDSPCEHLLAQ